MRFPVKQANPRPGGKDMSDETWGTVYRMERDKALGDDPESLRADNERLRAALRGALRMVEDFASGAGFSPSGRAEFEGYRCALEGKT
jgi:hypothetical protein